jgi:hypothetical protein
VSAGKRGVCDKNEGADVSRGKALIKGLFFFSTAVFTHQKKSKKSKKSLIL